MPRTRKIDLRGLTLAERALGAIVHTAGGTYKVVAIARGQATLERVKDDGVKSS